MVLHPRPRSALHGPLPPETSATLGGLAFGVVAVVLALAGVALPSPASAQSAVSDDDRPVPGAAAPDAAAPRADQRVVLVTGSTSGLGREVARRLAAAGDHVIVHGRSVERGTALVEEIRSETPGSARFYATDFASFDRVRALADEIAADYDRLDVLVNNAGIWLEDSDGRLLSEDGHELHFQVNYLAGYLLTEQLLPLVERGADRSGPARIVHVSSGAQRAIDFDDVMLEEGYDDGRGYAQSKLAQVMHTFWLAERLEGTGITVNALHPATMMDTNMVLSRGAQPRSDVDEGATAVMHLIDAPELGSGRYFNGTQPTRANAQAYDDDAVDRLMRISERLTRD